MNDELPSTYQPLTFLKREVIPLGRGVEHGRAATRGVEGGEGVKGGERVVDQGATSRDQGVGFGVTIPYLLVLNEGNGVEWDDYE